MTPFLVWLLSVAYRVYDWFGSGYDYARYVIDNIFDWTKDLIIKIYYQAIDFVDASIISVRNLISYTYSTLLDILSVAINSLYDGIQTLIHNVSKRVDYLSSFVNDITKNIRDYVDKLITSTKDNIITYLLDVISQKAGLLYQYISKLTPLSDYVNHILSIVEHGKSFVILDIINNYYTKLKLFFDNPSNYLYAILEKSLLSMLSYIIAVALGTENEDLPPKPERWE